MTNKDKILERITNSVRSAEPDATIILFGSYARGDYHPESDIDLLILVKSETGKISHQKEDGITFPLFKIAYETGVFISPMVYSEVAWANHIKSPFYENVNREGIRL